MVSYFQTVCYSADVLSLILHIQRIGGLEVGQTSGFGFARCLRLIADNKYFSGKGLFKSPDMVLEVVQENDKMCKITRKK
jgi:hypothetical protein